MKVVAIVQARMGSTRLPNKVMKEIAGRPMLEILLARLSRAKELSEIIVATSFDRRNLCLIEAVRKYGYQCFQGSENDVLDRFYTAAKFVGADVIVRITGDCPLVDPELVDKAICEYRQNAVDYYSNVDPPTYPDGLDLEVFSFNALEVAARDAKKDYEREHVTPYIRESMRFRTMVMSNKEDLSDLRLTVDEQADLAVMRNIFQHFRPDVQFSWHKVVELSRHKPEIFAPNRHIKRNEGLTMRAGQKLWKRAKKIIPGGNMLLSKRAEMFLPDGWPTYYSKANDCRVWDLDDNCYVDMSIMGIGTNILGYGHPEVDGAVKRAVEAGNMSTFNCPEEVYLAEKLIEIHTWADMVRFARTGGEANAVAIRIARAASGRDKIAICGYHGWHDWYLAANLGDYKSLDGHLLPGLAPVGVPRNLRATVFPFGYNNFLELEALVNSHDIGVIKMEVVRNKEPEDGFLEKVRKLATDRNIVLIFDESTSGFRQTLGGLHKLYGVEPDIAVFGKALGNGYAITAVLGRREIMECAQSSFISSTFWTERIGFSAALKTLEIMERTKSWEIITERGLQIRKRWGELADHYGLKIEHWGLPALTGFTFQTPRALAYKTLITQEMLAKGYLAGNCVYVCTEHTPKIIDQFFEALDPIFGIIKECEEGKEITSLLNGPICHSGFVRLN